MMSMVSCLSLLSVCVHVRGWVQAQKIEGDIMTKFMQTMQAKGL
jgi:hypothetical protein